MHLPNELVLEVVYYLEKRDLKTIRLVSKLWSAYASEFLFDKIYKSLRKEDLESFEAIYNDPLPRKCVKTLEYDAIGFSTELTKDEYMEGLWTQILPMTITNNSESQTPFDCPDSQINEFVEIIKNALKILS